MKKLLPVLKCFRSKITDCFSAAVTELSFQQRNVSRTYSASVGGQAQRGANAPNVISQFFLSVVNLFLSTSLITVFTQLNAAALINFFSVSDVAFISNLYFLNH